MPRSAVPARSIPSYDRNIGGSQGNARISIDFNHLWVWRLPSVLNGFSFLSSMLHCVEPPIVNDIWKGVSQCRVNQCIVYYY